MNDYQKSKSTRKSNYHPAVPRIQNMIEDYYKAGKFKGMKPKGPIGINNSVYFKSKGCL